ncbi:MAG: hypothetical protein AUI14_07870 [Actinobacteria bacterium 13_2_20CM_2_71_6]|nr:MAG: hypothetical protein AUI14_07870 [Actinobacteria bacterium 13_2_20CM_2_71_6]
MPTYVRWYWPDDDTWNYEELDADRWASRHVEVRAGDGTFVAAGSLAEVLAARDTGRIEAVQEYEARWGVVPSDAFPEAPVEWPLEPVSASEFETLWQEGRRHLGA